MKAMKKALVVLTVLYLSIIGVFLFQPSSAQAAIGDACTMPSPDGRPGTMVARRGCVPNSTMQPGGTACKGINSSGTVFDGAITSSGLYKCAVPNVGNLDIAAPCSAIVPASQQTNGPLIDGFGPEGGTGCFANGVRYERANSAQVEFARNLPSGAIQQNDGSCAQLTGDDKVSSNSLIKIFCNNAPSALAGKNVIYVVINGLITYLTGILQAVLVIMIVIAGVQISASSGSPAAIQAAKKRMSFALSSFALIFAGRLILDLFGITGGVFLGSVPIDGEITFWGPDSTLAKIIQAVLQYAFFASGSISVAFVIVGGIRMMTSVGQPQGLAAARKTIVYALGGLAVSLLAYFIVGLVSRIITG
ncbi:hypothetical protein KBC99_02165 [Candidatus Saccharibacteria bacterium]|nr:hypothetical protein [Candidatus Saccharibacteria bacterium]